MGWGVQENPSKGRISALAWSLGLVALALLAAHLSAWRMWPDGSGYTELLGRNFQISAILSLSGERTIPSLYSAALFFVIGALACEGAARTARPAPKLGWYLIAVVAVFLGVDEAISIHENISALINDPMRAALRTMHFDHPALHWTWVIPYAALALVVAAVSLPWFATLGFAARIYITSAAATYLAGAVGVEMLESWRAELMGGYDFARQETLFRGLETVEETLEIVGLSLAVLGFAVQIDRGIEILIRPRVIATSSFVALSAFIVPRIDGGHAFALVAAGIVMAAGALLIPWPSHRAPSAETGRAA